MSKDIKQHFWKELADNPYLMVALDAGHALQRTPHQRFLVVHVRKNGVDAVDPRCPRRNDDRAARIK